MTAGYLRASLRTVDEPAGRADAAVPVITGFRPAPVGSTAGNTVRASSRPLLPVPTA